MTLWKALALLAMMVPAVVAKRQEKPVLSTRMALSYIYNAGYRGGRHLSMDNVAEIKRGAVAKHFWSDYTGVATAIDEALVKLESRGNITLPADYKRAFVQWDTLEEVRGGIIVHLNWVLAHKQFPTRKLTVAKYRKLWLTLGGTQTDLTTVVENALLRLCGQGRLKLPAVREKMVVLHPFSGSGVSKQAFLDAGYTHVLESDTVISRNMGPCVDDVQLPEAYDVSTTAERSGKAGAFAEHLCQQPEAKGLSIVESDTNMLAAGFPCGTYVLNPSNEPMDKHFRDGNGEPRPFELGNHAGNAKRSTAIGIDTMLEDFCLSILRWLLKAAAQGLQRWFYLENGLASQIWNRPPVRRLIATLGIEVVTVNYCAYSIFRGIGVQCTYPTRKSTGLLTNIPFSPKTCPRLCTPNNSDETSKSGCHEHRGQIAGPAGTERPTFLGVPQSVCCFVMPAGLVYDLALASMGHSTSVVVPKSLAYSLTANLSAPLPMPNNDCGFQLPEHIFDDVFRSNPGLMVEMRGRKKQRRDAP
jgi:hypothetical protein